MTDESTRSHRSIACVGHERERVHVTLRAPASADRGAWAALHARIRSTDQRVVVCDVGELRHPDCATVDHLARLQLTARRHGRAIRLRRARPELRELIGLCGLADVLAIVSDEQGEGGG